MVERIVLVITTLNTVFILICIYNNELYYENQEETFKEFEKLKKDIEIKIGTLNRVIEADNAKLNLIYEEYFKRIGLK